MAKLTTTPRSTVATLQQDNPVVLSCKTNKPDTILSWAFNDRTNIIFSGYTVKERYPVLMNREAGEFNISLSSLDASYAGRYTCLEPGTMKSASAQLTILGMLRVFSNKKRMLVIKIGRYARSISTYNRPTSGTQAVLRLPTSCVKAMR